MLFSEWLFTPAGLESVLRVRPLFREFLTQISIGSGPLPLLCPTHLYRRTLRRLNGIMLRAIKAAAYKYHM